MPTEHSAPGRCICLVELVDSAVEMPCGDCCGVGGSLDDDFHVYRVHGRRRFEVVPG